MDDLRSELKLVLDMTTRVDERLKIICEKQQEANTRLNQLVDSHIDITSRVRVLEAHNELSADLDEADEIKQRLTVIEAKGSPAFIEFEREMQTFLDKVTGHLNNLDQRLRRLEEAQEGWWGRVGKLTQLGVQAVWVVLVCYVLYRLGLSSPPIP